MRKHSTGVGYYGSTTTVVSGELEERLKQTGTPQVVCGRNLSVCHPSPSAFEKDVHQPPPLAPADDPEAADTVARV